MKNKILLIFCLIIASNLYAGINSAGFSGSATGITFGDSKTNGSPNQENYLRTVAGVFGCPKPGENQTMILHELNPKTGNITCYLYGENSTDPIEIYKQTGISQEKFLEETTSIKQILDSGEYRNLVVGERFGAYEFNQVNQGYTEKFVQLFDLGSLYAINESVKQFLETSINSASKDDKSAFSSANLSLDSYTNPQRVLSNILTGLITLNPDYFDANNLVNENGTISLKDYALFGEGNTEGYRSGDTDNFFKNATRSILGNNDEATNVGLQVTTVAGFLDKKFWGFYAYLIYNLKEAYIYILGTMMLFGGGFALSKFGYTRMKQKINKDDEHQGKGKLASKSMDVFLVVMMFLIPISTNTAKIPDTFLYTKSNKANTGTVNYNAQNSEELFTHSTMSSSLIRYFSNMGSTWANVINDYALFSYIRYLESKQKAITAQGISSNEENIKNLYVNTFYLKKDYDFYIEVCRGAFSSVLSSATRFNSISDESKDSFLNNTINLTGTPIGDILGYTKINPYLCVQLEENIFTETKKILAEYSRVQLELNVSKKIMDNYSTKTAKDFNTYVDFMQFVSNNFGWISSAVVPPSYSLLFSGNNSAFAYDVAQKSITNSDGNNLSQSWAGNKDDNKEIKEDGWTNGFIAGALSKIQGQFIWFVMPGFDGIFKNIYQYLSNIAFLDPSYYQTTNGSKSFVETIIDILIAWFTGGIGLILKKLLFFIVKTGVTSALYFILLYISMWLAIKIYTIMITTVTMLIIGGAITIKICLYFMELLMYYFLNDAILFISIVTQRNDYFIKFLSKGMVITLLTPSLIVLSVYAYMLFHTLAVELYKMLVSSIYEITMMQNSTIIENNGGTAVNAILQTVAISSTQSFGEVVILLFSVIIGTTAIFKFKDWVFKMIGIDDDGISATLGAEISQKITGGLNPVK